MKRRRIRRRSNPGVSSVLAVGAAEAAPVVGIIVIAGIVAYLLYREIAPVVDAAAKAAKAYAKWDGDPNHPIIPTNWEMPEWAKETGAAAAYHDAQAAGAGNPVSGSPAAGPYMPPNYGSWDY